MLDTVRHNMVESKGTARGCTPVREGLAVDAPNGDAAVFAVGVEQVMA